MVRVRALACRSGREFAEIPNQVELAAVREPAVRVELFRFVRYRAARDIEAHPQPGARRALGVRVDDAQLGRMPAAAGDADRPVQAHDFHLRLAHRFARLAIIARALAPQDVGRDAVGEPGLGNDPDAGREQLGLLDATGDSRAAIVS